MRQPQRGARRRQRPGRRAAIGAVSGHLSVTLLGRTFVILVTVESTDGTMSARIANAIAEVYLADQVDNKNEANRRATEWLEERLAELRRNLQVAEESVATYRRDKGLAGSPEGVDVGADPDRPQRQVSLPRRRSASRRKAVWSPSARRASIRTNWPISPKCLG